MSNNNPKIVINMLGTMGDVIPAYEAGKILKTMGYEIIYIIHFDLSSVISDGSLVLPYNLSSMDFMEQVIESMYKGLNMNLVQQSQKALLRSTIYLLNYPINNVKHMICAPWSPLIAQFSHLYKCEYSFLSPNPWLSV